MAADDSVYVQTPFPQQVVIETTAGCNQKCIFCGRTYMERPKKTMARPLFERIVEEIAAESPYTELWPTFMGESTLLGERLFSMIEHARRVGCRKITLNTNGTRLDETTVPRLAECGIDRLIVSCDANTPETHAIVRPPIRAGTGGLDRVFRGVELLLDEIARRGEGPLVEMQFSLFAENEHEVDAFREHWLARGTIVKVRPRLYWSGSVGGGPAPVAQEERVPCLWALDTAGIHWNGSVVMCVDDCDGKYVAGSVGMQTLKDIWNGPLRWLRQLQIERRFSELPEICRRCPDWRMKRARAYFPDEEARGAYEDYLRQGRTFMEDHFWAQPAAPRDGEAVST